MPAKRKTNKKSEAGKRKPKKVKLDVRISEKASNDLPAEKQAGPLALEPKQKNVFKYKKHEKTFLKSKKQNKIFVEKEKVDFEEIGKSKNMIMRFGVAFFMILIVALWVFNFKKSFVELESENKSESINWAEITDEFSKSMNRMKQEMDKAKSAVEESALPDMATGTEENLSISQDEINELKERLEKLENSEKQATSTEEDLPLSN